MLVLALPSVNDPLPEIVPENVPGVVRLTVSAVGLLIVTEFRPELGSETVPVNGPTVVAAIIEIQRDGLAGPGIGVIDGQRAGASAKAGGRADGERAAVERRPAAVAVGAGKGHAAAAILVRPPFPLNWPLKVSTFPLSLITAPPALMVIGREVLKELPARSVPPLKFTTACRCPRSCRWW